MLGAGMLQTQPCSSAHVNFQLAPRGRSAVFFRPPQTTVSRFLDASSFFTGHRGLCASAARNRTVEKGGAVEMEVFDFDDDGEEEYEVSEDEDLEMEEEDESPWGFMRKRFRKKPSGFGKGKVYDTSIEDQLVQEMEQATRAQLANINNLKNNPLSPNSTSGQRQLPKAPKLSPSGFRVRLFNLPKKKNIHRDLQAVFKQFPGMIKFYPAVSGNKKTRDPICKGFGFVDLISKDDAIRFIRTFSGQSITFGKIKKQIKCEMMHSLSPDSLSPNSTPGPHSNSKVARLSVMEGDDTDVNFLLDNAFMASSHTPVPDESDGLNTDLEKEELELLQENEEPPHVSKIDDGNARTGNMDLTIVSSPSKEAENPRKIKEKQYARTKVEKIPKLNIPGSARRLEVKDKTVLTSVLSKYGTKANSN